MNRQLVFVHGRSQQGKDSTALKSEWIGAWERGLAKSGLRRPISDDQIRFPYYGDTLDQMSDGLSPEEAAKVVVRGERPLPPSEGEFLQAWLGEVQARSGIGEAEVEQALRAGQTRGVQNWGWVQAILGIIDRKIPGASGVSVAVATRDVYQYLHHATVRKVMDDGVRSAFKAGTETVVVSHSLGTVVAYNVLAKGEPAPGVRVPEFITLGSPLAVAVVKARVKPLVYPLCVDTWFNAMDERDVVALFPLDSRNFEVVPAIENKTDVDNDTSNRHGITGYLSDAVVAERIYRALIAH
ncbi:hypothetical protein KY495_04295 [Massilia sp. PAMC28688]|uniref:hypothetical protein n=1 Tax=Massilia sp. PAMC28688 TaxID=2861283 RepID=UPI001C634D74|nr:hypothetical protein [Massilia sp. PAMC28688]QYF94444.1 hypothetical protein KY495_04295 [Massilia sp. PAMC28688]